MKILVTGASGMLGRQVVLEGLRRGHTVAGYGKAEMDITDLEEVVSKISECVPGIVIHCAAYTNVEKAETQPDECRLVNVEGTKNIAMACRDVQIPMMYISTDYVFDGSGEEPWETTDECNPINVYGQTKYLGEQGVKELLAEYYIVRISWLFGPGGMNFVDKILGLAASQPELSVVCDQTGSPTYTVDLAASLLDIAESKKYGTYHATNEGYCTWHEFAAEILKAAGLHHTKVNPVATDALNYLAKRPKNSRLSKRSLDLGGFGRMRTWQDALSDYLAIECTEMTKK